MSDNNSTVATICSPAIVYLCFSLIQIIVDIYKKQFNTAFFKFWVMIIVTTMLNILCERGMGVVSWLIVFIPLILMTVLIVILIYFVGFKPGQPNKVFNNDPAKQEAEFKRRMMENNMKMQQQIQQMNNINNQTTKQTDNTPSNTLEVNPPEPSRNPRAIATRGSKPENGQNVPADKLETVEVSVPIAGETVSESFTSTHQNSTLNNYKSSFLSPETFFTY